MDYFSSARFDMKTKPKTLLNPETFSKEKLLGQGAFGSVYQVRDQAGRIYALKLLTDVDPAVFNYETAAIKKISAYPNCLKDTVCYIDSFKMYADI